MSNKQVVAIDGPAGSGKSTVAAKLANRLGFIHLNSGALFRAVGLRAKSEGLSLEDDSAVAELAARMQFEFVPTEGGASRLFVDGVEVTGELGTEEAGKGASLLGLLPGVRKVLLEVQRSIAQESSVVVEGRDAGTVVFPDASHKFFLDAAPEVRAQRRFLQLKEKGDLNLTLEQVQEQLGARDEQDSTREIAPSVQAGDAEYVDTTRSSIDEVINALAEKITEKK